MIATLPTRLAPIQRHLDAIARAWVAGGALGCSLRHDDGEAVELAGNCGDDPTCTAPLGGTLRGWELAVHGGDAQPARLLADADLLASIADRSSELTDTASALIETNDQLIAIYGLAASSTSSKEGKDLIESLADDVRRITRATAVLIAFANGLRVSSGAGEHVRVLDRMNAAGGDWVYRSDEHGAGYDIVLRRLPGNHGSRIAIAARAGHRFTTADLKLVDAVTYFLSSLISLELLHQAALASAVIERDAATAAELAQMVMPKVAPDLPGIEVAARCDPARLAAGDFYTWAETPKGLVFAVGDVSGKGLGAAMVMAMVTSATTRAALASGDPEPSELFRTLARELSPYLDEAGVFVTMLIGVYRPGDDWVRLANAGHSPVLVRSGGTTSMLPPSAPPLGVLPDLRTETVTIPFRPGDLVVVGSDGLAEQQNPGGEQLGYDELCRLVHDHGTAPAGVLVDELFGAVDAFADGADRDDDRTALVVLRSHTEVPT